MRIGLLSDTHLPGTIRELWDEVRIALAGVDLILHAGDIVTPSVLDWLDQIAPTLAARGNNDHGLEDRRIEHIQHVEAEGWRIAVVHDMEPEDRPVSYLVDRYLSGYAAQIIVTGHTHHERIDYREGALQVNPGSPTLPHLWSTRLGTIGILDLAPGRMRAEIRRLGETEGRRNPGRDLAFDLDGDEARSGRSAALLAESPQAPIVVAGAGGRKEMAFTLTSSAFEPGGSIPRRFTCDGDDLSPPLAWERAPPGVAAFALIMDDPDAPVGTWDHWVVFNLPPDARALPEGVRAAANLPAGAAPGRNSWGSQGYGGPCPPGGIHRYFFRLYALAAPLPLQAGASKGELLRAMEGRVLGQAELMGRYGR